MGKLLSKSLSIVAASLLAASFGLHAQQRTTGQSRNYDQSHAAEEHHLIDTYNKADRYDVRVAWDVFITGSFLYWQAREEALEYGISNPLGQGPIFGFLPNSDAKLLNLKWKYKPEFKVGFGMNSSFDDWQVYLEYTRFHSKISTSSISPNFPIGRIAAQWLRQFVFATEARAQWKLDMDILDLEIARPCYVGKSLTFRPHFGARAAWIDQHLNANYFSFVDGINRPSFNKSDSWALGSRAGIDTNWILGSGFRIIGNAAASLLYTRYTVQTRQSNVDAQGLIDLDVRETVRYLRPNSEFSLGFGFGTYIWENRMHIDLSALYEFHVFWNQNMMSQITENLNFGFERTMANLYLQGLTLTARVDF